MSIHSTLDHEAEGHTLERKNQKVGRILGSDNSLGGLPLEFLCERIKSYWLVTISLYFLVQSLSHVRFFVIPWTAACQPSLSIISSQSLLKLMSIESLMPSNHVILCWMDLLLLSSIFPSIRVFSNDSVVLIRWPKYWSFSFNISSSNENSGLVFFFVCLFVLFVCLFFRIHWFDLLVVQGTLKSLF